MFVRVIFITAASLGIWASAQSQIVHRADGYLFRIKFAKNKVVRYRSVVSAQGAPGQKAFSVVFPITQRVKTLSGSTASISIESGPMSINGQKIGSVSVHSMTVSTRGQLLSGGGANSGITMFPNRAIQPGESWSAEVPLPSAGGMTGGSTNVLAKYRFVRMTKMDGKDVAELAVAFSSKGASTVDGHGTTYVLASDGNLLGSTLNLDVALGPNGEVVAVAVNVSRL